MKKIIIFILLINIMLISSCKDNSKTYNKEDYKVELTYHDDFKILTLSDLHFGEVTDVDYQYKFLTNNITEANPSLIIINGDTFFQARKREVKNLFDFIDSFKIPWVYVQGNHDHQGLYAYNYVERYITTKDYCLNVDYEDDDIEGYENFYIDLVDGTDLLYRLFIIDSGNYLRKNIFKYTYGEISDNQLKHIEDIQSSTTDTSYTSIAFFHIPVNEMADAITKYQNGEIIGNGEFREDACPSAFNHNQFERLKNAGISLIVNGHDHINDAVVIYDGVILNYDVKSTDQIYHDDDMLGYEIITLPRSSFDISNIERVFHTYEEVINNGK